MSKRQRASEAYCTAERMGIIWPLSQRALYPVRPERGGGGAEGKCLWVTHTGHGPLRP